MSSGFQYDSEKLAALADPQIKHAMLNLMKVDEDYSKVLMFGRGPGLQARMWERPAPAILGSEDFYGVEGIFASDVPADDSSLFSFFVAQSYLGRLSHLKESQAGIAFQVERAGSPRMNLWVFDGSRFSNPKFKAVAPSSYLQALSDARKFIIEQYRKRLKLSEAQLRKLESISRQVENRSIVILTTEERFIDFSGKQVTIFHDRVPQRWPNHALGARPGFWNHDTSQFRAGGIIEPEFFGKKTDPFSWVFLQKSPEHFNIQSSVTAVLSRSVEEPLPMEMYRGFTVERAPGEVIAELGRFSVSKTEVKELSAKLLKEVAAIVASRGNIDRLVIEADPPHARLFKELGFKIIHEFKNENGEVVDHVMSVTPQEMFKALFLAK
jgi:hypothetical protein